MKHSTSSGGHPPIMPIVPNPSEGRVPGVPNIGCGGESQGLAERVHPKNELHLSRETWGMLRWISSKRQKSVRDIIAAGIEHQARELAREFASKGKAIPLWIAKELDRKENRR